MTDPYRYLPGFLAPDEATALFERLRREAPWQQEWLTLYGRRTPVPRLIAWCGDDGLNYRYSGTDHPCTGWLAALGPLRRRLMDALGVHSNMVLLNRYRDGSDCIGWHSDDERGLADRIVSVSLGARRRFLLRVDPGRSESLRLDLEHGSALLMDGRLRHALPRTRRPVGERINLTFRRLDAVAA